MIEGLNGGLEEPSSSILLAQIFGNLAPQARHYAHLLSTEAVERGLIGPREVPIVWDRHIFNCAVVAQLLRAEEKLVDIGSGAGLPGVPLALALPKAHVVLMEPLQRRSVWLQKVVDELSLGSRVEVRRVRAEEVIVSGEFSVAVARAVAPLVRLIPMAFPLLAPGGRLFALKGRRAFDELAVARTQLGELNADIVTAGEFLPEPTTIVSVIRSG